MAIEVGPVRSSCSKQLFLCHPFRRVGADRGRSVKAIFLELHPRAVLWTLREFEAVRPPFAVKVNQLPLPY